MIETQIGNILDIQAGIIVHGVNCRGVMGSGVAKKLRDMYPKLYSSYRQYVDSQAGAMGNSETLLGHVHWYEPTKELAIANAFTQDAYGQDGAKYVSYDAIHDAFKIIGASAVFNKRPIYFPMIGAGLGGGSWEVIKTIIEDVVPDSVPATLVLLPPRVSLP